ncbi:MAG: divalent-cation tolerance protein CutA [Myxococcota bacterium]
MTEPDALRVLLSTAAPEDAERIVATLVEERLVACGNIVPGVLSIYRWKAEVCREAESVLIMETTAARVSAAMERLAALHPYDTPKIVALSPDRVLDTYLQWACEATTPDDGASSGPTDR